jgi:hypothetical protein
LYKVVSMYAVNKRKEVVDYLVGLELSGRRARGELYGEPKDLSEFSFSDWNGIGQFATIDLTKKGDVEGLVAFNELCYRNFKAPSKVVWDYSGVMNTQFFQEGGFTKPYYVLETAIKLCNVEGVAAIIDWFEKNASEAKEAIRDSDYGMEVCSRFLGWLPFVCNRENAADFSPTEEKYSAISKMVCDWAGVRDDHAVVRITLNYQPLDESERYVLPISNDRVRLKARKPNSMVDKDLMRRVGEQEQILYANPGACEAIERIMTDVSASKEIEGLRSLMELMPEIRGNYARLKPYIVVQVISKEDYVRSFTMSKAVRYAHDMAIRNCILINL